MNVILMLYCIMESEAGGLKLQLQSQGCESKAVEAEPILTPPQQDD